MKKQISAFFMLPVTCFAKFKAMAVKPGGLNDNYKNYFPIGEAVSVGNLKTSGDVSFILAQFNSLRPHKAMKKGPIQPDENKYNLRGADSIVAFAQTNIFKIMRHNFCLPEKILKGLARQNQGIPVSEIVLIN